MRGEDHADVTREIAVPVAAFVAFASISYLWTSATAPARNLLEYFLLPFAVLVTVVARSPFPAWAPRVLAVLSIGLAGLFAVIGLVEEATHRLIYYTPVGRDRERLLELLPRHLAVPRPEPLRAPRRARDRGRCSLPLWYATVGLRLGAALIALLFAGLFFSYSQSSFAALFAIALFTVAVAGDRPIRIAATAITVVILAGGAVYGVHKLSTSSTQRVTSDRSRRVDLTWRVFEHHPIVGVGIGSQPRASQQISTEGGAPTLRLAHDAAHGRRGARADRTRGLTLAPRRRRAHVGARATPRSASRAVARRRLRRPPRPLGLLQRLLRGSDDLARARRRGVVPRLAGAEAGVGGVTERIPRRAALAVLGVLGALVARSTLPLLGADPWPFRPSGVNPHGVLAPLVRAAHRHWDLGVVRTPAVLALALIALVAVVGWNARSWSRNWLVVLCVAVVGLVTVPAVALQVGLRDATAPWFHTNDSTYQIELAGDLVRHGHDPYGHD